MMPRVARQSSEEYRRFCLPVNSNWYYILIYHICLSLIALLFKTLKHLKLTMIQSY